MVWPTTQDSDTSLTRHIAAAKTPAGSCAWGTEYLANLVDGGPGKNNTVCQKPPSDELPEDMLTAERAVLLAKTTTTRSFRSRGL
ncbi:unnamed protein product [Phytophthora lilii]|uniref:Unnamed protein product n=1 Tax=Phytophthora lilii TaxID=2077276 RepID=A0A9W6XD24_9STRA|nr:unnamed protein product [Phytophthora lilii]